MRYYQLRMCITWCMYTETKDFKTSALGIRLKLQL